MPRAAGAQDGTPDSVPIRDAHIQADQGLWDCLVDYQRTYMALRNFAEATRRGYASDLSFFIRYLTDTASISTVGEVKRTHLHDYFAELDRRGQAGATRARKLAAIKSFFTYLEDAGIIDRNPAKGIARPKQDVRQPRVLTEQEYEALRQACNGHVRDAALMELFLQTGLRLSEVASLTRGDLQLPIKPNEGCIGAVTVTGKGRKRRTVSLNSKACEALRAYLDGRLAAKSSRLFLSKGGGGLTSRAIQRTIKKYMSKAGITDASVHTLRHTFVTHMVRKGTNLRVVQEALGHTSLQTTSVYVSLARELMDQQLQANAL
jgi:site-specific recombinase XerD